MNVNLVWVRIFGFLKSYFTSRTLQTWKICCPTLFNWLRYFVTFPVSLTTKNVELQCQQLTGLSRVYLINGTFSTRPKTACFSWRMVALGLSIIFTLHFQYFAFVQFLSYHFVSRSVHCTPFLVKRHTHASILLSADWWPLSTLLISIMPYFLVFWMLK